MRIYVQAPVEERELRSLVTLAKAEEEAFFQRNPHLVRLYRDRLVVVALCQGAALQYLRSGYGVKDFDVHFFYAQNPAKLRLSRAVKRIHATVGRFRSVPVDFIRTVIPTQKSRNRRSIEEQIRSFLESEATANALHLSRKAVIGLDPPDVLGETLWRPETPVEGAAYHCHEVVKILGVRYGQGETASPDVNERLLSKHLGEMCQIVEVAEGSIQLRLKDGKLAWAIPEEISRDPNATVRKPALAGSTDPTATRKTKLRRRKGRNRLDLSLFRTSRVYRPGSGQTRKVGSWRS